MARKKRFIRIRNLIISIIPVYLLLWIFNNLISLLTQELGNFGTHIGLGLISLGIGSYFMIYWEEFGK